jgi:uncharacterized RDD family membrane protein YckC
MQNLWSKRFTALIIDALLITLIIWVLSALLYPLIAIADGFSVLNYWLLVTVISIITYFTYLEGSSSKTLGKNLMKIKVISNENKMDYKKAFIRNLSKILWIPLILDVLVSYVSNSSKLRYLDEVAGTNVIMSEAGEKKEKESQVSQKVLPDS